MTLRIVSTAAAGALEFPAPREDRFDSAFADAIVPSPARENALARLREPGALAVTTGQQPGLFTGPLYTLYKALSAAGLARILERQWQRPVVPVFWVAGDDHDYAEASHASWITAEGAVRHMALPPRTPEAPLTPLYRQPLGEEIGRLLEVLAADLAPSEFREWTLEWLHRHYTPDATMAASFGGALAELLAPAGVVCLESSHPVVKRAASRYLIKALGLARELDADLEARSDELLTAGVDPAVPVGDGATLVMMEGPLGRDRLLMDDGAFITRRSRERFDLPALQRTAAAEPERLSPNVLLRPVVESSLLPTVAYLAGPSEMKYLALAQPVYERMRVARQLVLPRWSGVLVEPRVDRVLHKFGIELHEMFEPPGSLESRLVRSQLPEEATRALQTLGQHVLSGYEMLAKSAVDIDPTLARPVEGAKNQALAAIKDIEKKLIQHLKRRQEVELGQLAKARALVLPDNQLQERVLTIAPFLARHGPALVTELSEAVESWYAAALEGALDPS
jgi:bacillithiol biosynthesis cysteine-adding enzyme BshC